MKSWIVGANATKVLFGGGEALAVGWMNDCSGVIKDNEK